MDNINAPMEHAATSPVKASPSPDTTNRPGPPSPNAEPSKETFLNIFRSHELFLRAACCGLKALDSWEPPHQSYLRSEQARIFREFFLPTLPPERRNRNIQMFWEAIDSDSRPLWASMGNYLTLRSYYLSQATMLAEDYAKLQPLREVLGYLVREWECVDGAAEHFVSLSKEGRERFMWDIADYLNGPYASSIVFKIRMMNRAQIYRDESYDRRRQV